MTFRHPHSVARPLLALPLLRVFQVFVAIVAAGLSTSQSHAGVPAGGAMVQAANVWLATLAPEQKARALKPWEDAGRVGWHFIPKFERKGLPLREMVPSQQQGAFDLLRAAVSQAGYDKSRSIMQLDEMLRLQEGSNAKNIRDAERYFFTIFGTPAEKGTWGLSVEGHHLSLNFVVRDGQVVDSTPQFFGANPAEVRTRFYGLPEPGFRVLGMEEQLAFDLVRSFDATQKAKGIIAPECPKDIRAAGETQSPKEPAKGIPASELKPEQQALLRRIIETYCFAMADEVAKERLMLIEKADGGWNAIHFAWAGATEPGIGHYYLVEGPSFVIEFCNVQPDAEGNPANHIHCVWRDRTGDFDLPANP